MFFQGEQDSTARGAVHTFAFDEADTTPPRKTRRRPSDKMEPLSRGLGGRLENNVMTDEMFQSTTGQIDSEGNSFNKLDLLEETLDNHNLPEFVEDIGSNDESNSQIDSDIFHNGNDTFEMNENILNGPLIDESVKISSIANDSVIVKNEIICSPFRESVENKMNVSPVNSQSPSNENELAQETRYSEIDQIDTFSIHEFASEEMFSECMSEQGKEISIEIPTISSIQDLAAEDASEHLAEENVIEGTLENPANDISNHQTENLEYKNFASESSVTENFASESSVTESIVTESIVTESSVTESIVTENIATKGTVSENPVAESVEEDTAQSKRVLRTRESSSTVQPQPTEFVTRNEVELPTKTICFTSSPGLAKPHGFINLGNTCYMNCVLQCVLTVPSFKCHLNTPYNPIKPTLLSCISGLMRHKSVNGSTKEKRELLTRVKKFISDATSLFKGSRQQDAHEFLGKLLDVLREERKISLKCPVSRTFQCEVIHTLRCMSCSAGGQKMEQYYDFSLNLPTRNTSSSNNSSSNNKNNKNNNNNNKSNNNKRSASHNLAELLDSYFAPDQVELRCSVCGHDTAHVQHRFNRLPQTLVLHVQRYSFSRS